ncbi:unnamed protein product [Diabrotica balteata]|uniref:Uncharacterized protein n=1 Tax=Diabrotica balteata TaxID=107213 RepID=A0A9N9SN80_DIABA|nr:unnamed protein product [Diabrotica balteata]
MVKLKPFKDTGSPCCCCKNLIYKVELLRNDIGKLKREKRCLNNKLNDAISSQHKAMYKAIHLADRNKLLEDEMKAIDALALKVEEESNYTNATNINIIRLLEDQLNTTEIALQLSKCEITKLKNKYDQLTDQFDTIKGENNKLSSLLEAVINEKQLLISKLNTAQIIEEALNQEIDKIQTRVGKQNRLISELQFESRTAQFNGNQSNNGSIKDLEDQNGSIEESVSLENSQIHRESKRASTDDNEPEYRRKVNKAKNSGGKTKKIRRAITTVKDLEDQNGSIEESVSLENSQIHRESKRASTDDNQPEYRRKVNKAKNNGGKTRKIRRAITSVKDLEDQSETMEESLVLENNRNHRRLKRASTEETNKPEYRRVVNKSKNSVRSKSTESGKATDKKKDTTNLIRAVKHKNNHRKKEKDCIGTKLIDPADTIPRGYHLNHLTPASSSARKIYSGTLRKNNNSTNMAHVPSTSQHNGANETVFSDTLINLNSK